MIVGLIDELTIVGIHDRGVPNQERIVITVNDTINLGQYGLMIGIRGTRGMAFPIKDNLLWFGDGVVNKGDWVFIYTGPGQAKVSSLPNTNECIYSLHWGRDWTAFASQELVPILFRIDAVQVPTNTMDLTKLAK
jgi:hypothetical protein